MIVLPRVRSLAASALALGMLVLPALASALTVSSLASQKMNDIYGQYAPHGDCGRGPVISIDGSGFTFKVGGRTVHPARFEIAYSYMGRDYQGISTVFFPFIRNDMDLGATMLTVNADEVRGKITVSNRDAPGVSSVQRALAKASPHMRCGAAATGAAGAPPPKAPPPSPGITEGSSGPPWELRPVQGRAPVAFVKAADSENILSFSLFCNKGRPVLAMLLKKPPTTVPVVANWNFAGRIVGVPMAPGNRKGTFWLADLGHSELPRQLVKRHGFAYLRLNGEMQGQASLSGSTHAVETALGSCYRF